MFTGLIEATGTIRSLEPRRGATRLRVACPEALIEKLRTGDSVAVSGVCLTALDINPDSHTFDADLAAETIARTTLSHLHPGSIVNLELPTAAGAPLGGHVVQGHVDGVGAVRSLKPLASDTDASTDWWLQLTLSEDCMRYVVEKGSIAVEGISLTVARLEESGIAIAIIPHTYKVTNLHTLGAGDPVNIEVDVLAKYAERRIAESASELHPANESAFEVTLESLIAKGY
jgi:riboflavin synthase